MANLQTTGTSSGKKEKGNKKKNVGAAAFDSAAAAGTAVLTEAMLPEQTDAVGEIVQAQEGAGAKVVQVQTESEVVKPTDDKPAERPHYMTDDAHKQRRLDVANVGLRRFAAEHAVRAHFDGLVLAGRPADQALTLGEYRAYLLEAKQTASVSQKPQMFSKEAFEVIRFLPKEAKDGLYKKFNGQTEVGVTDELLLAVADAMIARDTKFSLAIDGEVMNCGERTCNRRFVPMSGIATVTRGGKSDIRAFGNFRQIGTQVVGFCTPCKNIAITDAHENNQPAPWFSPRAFAEKLAAHEEDVRNTKEGLRNTLQTANDFRAERDKRNDNRKSAGKFDPMQEARCRNSFSALLNNRDKDHSTGRYYSPEFEWKDNRSGKTVMTFIDLDVRRDSLVVTNAGPGLEALIGSSHNTGYFENKGLFAAINMAAEVQQRD